MVSASAFSPCLPVLSVQFRFPSYLSSKIGLRVACASSLLRSNFLTSRCACAGVFPLFYADLLSFWHLDEPSITVYPDGHGVSRTSDFILYSVEAEFIDRVVAQYGPCAYLLPTLFLLLFVPSSSPSPYSIPFNPYPIQSCLSSNSFNPFCIIKPAL